MSSLVTILTDDPHQREQWAAWLHAFDVETAATASEIPEGTILLLTTAAVMSRGEVLPPDALILCGALPDACDSAVAAGADDVFTLPGSAAVLANRVRRMLEASSAEGTFSATLQDIAASLLGQFDLDEVLQTILSGMKRVIPEMDSANIVLIEPDGETLQIARQVTYFSPEDPTKHRLHEYAYTLYEMPNLARMLKTRQPVLNADVRDNPTWVEMKDTNWICSYVGAPIVIQTQVIGFLNMDSSVPHAFKARHMAQVQAFAHHAAIGINNAQLLTSLLEVTNALDESVQAATRDLRDERAQLSTILNTIGEGVVYYDLEGRPAYINSALESLFGYPEYEWLADLVTVTPETISDEERDRWSRIILRWLTVNGVWQRETPFVRADGTRFDGQITIRPVQGPDDTIQGSVAVYRDMSQEKALREQQARFVSYASHELRTPITNMKTQLYLIRRRDRKSVV